MSLSTRLLGTVALAAVPTMAALPAHAADVGVSIQIAQPGVYGRIDIGRFPQPVVINTQPVVISRPVVVAGPPQPVYMWVPPGHQKKWSKHCAQYGACGVPVYFVQERWYNDHVNGHPGKGRGHDKGHDKGRGRD